MLIYVQGCHLNDVKKATLQFIMLKNNIKKLW